MEQPAHESIPMWDGSSAGSGFTLYASKLPLSTLLWSKLVCFLVIQLLNVPESIFNIAMGRAFIKCKSNSEIKSISFA